MNKDFLKDNIALIAAIVLPLLLIVVFALSTALMTVAVEDPRHSFLVATNYSNPRNSTFTLDVVNQRLVITYRPEEKNENGYYTNNLTPRLWRVNIPSRKVEEIALPVPPDKKATSISVPGVTDITINNSQPGPDGYSYVQNYHRDASIMTEIFSTGRERSSIALEKDGRRYPVRVPGNDWYYNSTFIGWIAEE